MYRSSKKMFRLLSGLLIALFFTGALPWRELRADANTHGDYNCAPLTVTYDQNSTWDLNTQGEFVITNASEEVVDGWIIRFEFAADLNNIVIVTHGVNGSITIGSEVFMGDIGCIVNGNNGEPGIPCDINVIDLQACHLAEVYDGSRGWSNSDMQNRYSGYSVARTFLCENGLHRVNHVYAWNGTSCFLCGYNMVGIYELFNREAGYYSFSLDCPEGEFIGRSVEYTTTYDY